MRVSLKKWTASNSPWIWLNAGALTISVLMVVGLLGLIAARGLIHFWPKSIIETPYLQQNGQVIRLIGEVVDIEEVPAQQLRDAGIKVPVGQKSMLRSLIKTGNRDISGSDFVWVLNANMESINNPRQLLAAERTEWGNLYGYLVNIKEQGSIIAAGEVPFTTDSGISHQPVDQAVADTLWQSFQQRVSRAGEIKREIYQLEKHDIGTINYGLERLRLKTRRLELDNDQDPRKIADIKAQQAIYNAQYADIQEKLIQLYQQLNRDSITVLVADGSFKEVSLGKIVRAYRPNNMNLLDKVAFYIDKLWEFVADDPREANTEGGIFPAIFGTVMMVLIMSIIVTPFGVVAAVYLREYARQGLVTRIIRIAVNNLAGVPAIVYGVFGLGFFVYFLGGNIDQLFYPEALPAPTFGTPGLIWASLTLALLTLPVVIVATEEGLARIPSAIREGSLALGATKAETLWRIVLPMSSPAMMTGVILAVARAAGEVAPLMLVGVVKMAPSLPVDGNYPFIHLDQKFMHLGFHIYDVGFQSPNVEAARPLVYATALLLVMVIALLNFSAVAIRNHLREKYKALEI